MFLPSHPISNVWFELYLTFSYEFNSQIPFHDLFELNGVSFSVQTPEVSQFLSTKLTEVLIVMNFGARFQVKLSMASTHRGAVIFIIQLFS